MTEIEQKALALVNEVREERGYKPVYVPFRWQSEPFEALCRAIEQHEAFKREVSDALEYFMDGPVGLGTARERLGRFILPKPVDPLVAVMQDCGFIDIGTAVDDIRAALAKRGLEVREIEK